MTHPQKDMEPPSLRRWLRWCRPAPTPIRMVTLRCPSGEQAALARVFAFHLRAGLGIVDRKIWS